MWSKVAQYVEKYKLLNPNELYLIALSGGADSVALLLLLKDAGFNVHAAHCNFHLRGVESDRDEAFCEQLCAVENVPFHRAHFDTRAYAELHKASIEMAARELRYRWFEQLRKDIGAAGICGQVFVPRMVISYVLFYVFLVLKLKIFWRKEARNMLQTVPIWRTRQQGIRCVIILFLNCNS